MAPAGKSSVTCILYSDYAYWEELSRDREAYEERKKILAAECIRAFEKRFPDAKGRVEAVDVLTPYTYSRYTGTRKGVYMGWMATPAGSMPRVPGTLPGLGGFHMAGQWANSSGGVPACLLTGRWSIMRICREDRRKFGAG